MTIGGAPGGGSGCGCWFTKTQLAFALFAFTVVPELPTLLRSRQDACQLRGVRTDAAHGQETQNNNCFMGGVLIVDHCIAVAVNHVVVIYYVITAPPNTQVSETHSQCMSGKQGLHMPVQHTVAA